jgi:hypothetical protein
VVPQGRHVCSPALCPPALGMDCNFWPKVWAVDGSGGPERE